MTPREFSSGDRRKLGHIIRRAKGWEVVAEFVGTASGTVAPTARPECIKAMGAAKELCALLVVAKLDRLSRGVEHIAAMVKRVPFKVATMPDADALQLHIYAALALFKARAESEDAEAQAKVARRDAGRRKAHEAGNRAAVVTTADAYAQTVMSHLKAARFDGITSLAGCAAYFNRHGMKTRRGAAFAPMTVLELLFQGHQLDWRSLTS